jgi:hypothetical protein
MAESTETSTTKSRSKTAKPSARKTPAAKQATAVAKPASSASTPKTAEKKTAAASSKATLKNTPASSISAEDRQSLIAEAAYLRAEQRNFVGGDPVTDWLEAEADVNARLMRRAH